MGQKRRGVLRAAALSALAGCVIWAVTLVPAYLKTSTTGDPAGFALSLQALLLVGLPIAGTLFVAAGLIRTPGWLDPKRGMILMRALGVGILAVLIAWGAGNLMSSARYYQLSVGVLVQNLVIGLPAIVFGLALITVGSGPAERRH